MAELAQAGHCMSPNSMISTGASGSPTVAPVWGRPWNISWTSATSSMLSGLTSSSPPTRLKMTSPATTTSAATTAPTMYFLFTRSILGRCRRGDAPGHSAAAGLRPRRDDLSAACRAAGASGHRSTVWSMGAPSPPLSVHVADPSYGPGLDPTESETAEVVTDVEAPATGVRSIPRPRPRASWSSSTASSRSRPGSRSRSPAIPSRSPASPPPSARARWWPAGTARRASSTWPCAGWC